MWFERNDPQMTNQSFSPCVLSFLITQQSLDSCEMFCVDGETSIGTVVTIVKFLWLNCSFNVQKCSCEASFEHNSFFSAFLFMNGSNKVYSNKWKMFTKCCVFTLCLLLLSL